MYYQHTIESVWFLNICVKSQEFMDELTRNTFKRLLRALFCILLKMSTKRTLAHDLTNPFKLYNKIGALFSYVNYDEEEVEA